jgi:hypothetical protein
VLRLDPRDGRVLGQARLPRTDALAVGPAGLYLTDFWHDRVRRLDSRTLRVESVLTLRLPFRFAPRDNAFLPIAVAAGASGLWVATARCALAHADVLARRVVATVRLACSALGGLALESGGVWVGESLLGVYRVDLRTDRVVWRRRIGPAGGRLAVDELIAAGGRLLAIGIRTKGNVATERRGSRESIRAATASTASRSSPRARSRRRSRGDRSGSGAWEATKSSASTSAPDAPRRACRSASGRCSPSPATGCGPPIAKERCAAATSGRSRR